MCSIGCLASTAGAINLRMGPVVDLAARDGGIATVGVQTQATGMAPEIGHLRIVVGLVWRTVVMWMVLLALLSLARLLG